MTTTPATRYDVYSHAADEKPVNTPHGIDVDHLDAILDIGAIDVDAAIEEAGWCGTTYYGTQTRVAIVAHGDALPPEARAYLAA